MSLFKRPQPVQPAPPPTQMGATLLSSTPPSTGTAAPTPTGTQKTNGVPKPKQKIHSTTQKFTELVDIVDDIVVLEGGYAAMVIEITASNFALLSKKEQDARVYSYAALLNSLTFPVQVLIRNKRVDISSYLKLLEAQEKQTKNELLVQHIRAYHEFVREMIRVNVVLNKTFYMCVSFSSLEGGISGVKQTVTATQAEKDAFTSQARKMLQSKADSLLGQLRKLAVSAKILTTEELVKLFYDIYNDSSVDAAQLISDLKAPIVHPDTQK